MGVLDLFDTNGDFEGYFFKISGKFPDFTGALGRDSYLVVQLIPSFWQNQEFRARAMAYMIGAGNRLGKKRLFLDYYSAVGFSASNKPSTVYHYGFVRLSDEFPLTLTFGVSLGYKF